VNANEADTGQNSFDMKGIDQCIHHQKVIEFFCEDEEKLCCSTCAIVNHRKCQSVVDVQTVVEQSKRKKSNVKVKLLEVKQKAEIISNSVASSKRKLEEDVQNIPVKIKKRRDEVNKMFDELEQSVVKNVDSYKSETFGKLTKKQIQNDNYLANISTCLDTIENVNQNGTSVQQFIVEQKMKEDINVLYKKVNAECKGLETMTVNFEFDETLKLPPLPISVHVPGYLTLKSHLSEAASTIAPEKKAIKLTPVCTIDLMQDEGKEPFYKGIDFLPDGRLVVVDNKNKKCLVYNTKLEKLGSFQLSSIPQSVVAVSDEKVMVTGGRSYKLDILRVDKSNEIMLDRSFTMTTRYDSVCIKDDEHFVGVTIEHPRPVRIIATTGEEKDFNINFPSKTYPLGASACTYIRNSEKVVLTDRYDHTVYIYDIKTNTRVVVKNDLIKEPCGAAVGPFDTILVCSQNTNSIVQISQTGRILSSYITDLKFPTTICVSRDKSFLVVSNAYNLERKLQKLKITY
jgi:WD40 repeat protein